MQWLSCRLLLLVLVLLASRQPEITLGEFFYAARRNGPFRLFDAVGSLRS